jgi:hypothetical protein
MNTAMDLRGPQKKGVSDKLNKYGCSKKILQRGLSWLNFVFYDLGLSISK